MSLNGITRSTLPVGSGMRISPGETTRAFLCVIDGLTFLREHRLDAGRFKNFPAVTRGLRRIGGKQPPDRARTQAVLFEAIQCKP
ncbi:MAG: hypothetical protein DME75_07440 [Verrucomicrobia bacterium]|nr:MAG: hypothetical protein DME75_07440 [Verrucomicrobiota bacterium]